MAAHIVGEMDQKPVIRRPTPADWCRIIEVLRIANYHHIGGPEMPEFPLEDCFVAEVDGRIAGVAGYRILDSEKAKTTLMVVDPAYRGSGVGYALQRARMDFLRSRGIRTLTTNCDDEAVIAWYCKHFGYEPTSAHVPKVSDFGLRDKSEWTTISCKL